MAANFNDLWQQNKPFWVFLGGSLALFLIGESAIGMLYGEDLDSARVQIRNEQKELRKVKATKANLESAETMNNKLKDGIHNMQSKAEFVASAEYQLVEGGASPENQYFDLVTKTREKVVREALHNNMEVPESLGLPTVSPTGKEEITRYLRGLDLTQRAILLAVQNDVDRIDTIQIEPQVRGKRSAAAQDASAKEGPSIEEVRVKMKLIGRGRSLARFLEATQTLERPLMLERAKLTAASKGDVMVGELEFLALRFLGVESAKK